LLHESRPPQVAAILKIMAEHEVQYVIVGSVAALLYGIDLQPADLDVVPALEVANLERLILVLNALGARPAGPFGEWVTLPSGEKQWVARSTTEEEIRAWHPVVHDISTLDAGFRSRFGNLDVVPNIAGTYDALKRRAVQLAAYGYNPWVAHVDDLLAGLTVPRREKDAARVARLRELQRNLGKRPGRPTTG